MSESRQFCPRCGDAVPADAVRTAAGARERTLCDDCYLEGLDLVSLPDELDVTVCAQCGAVKRGEHWTDVGARDYTDVAIDEVAERLRVHVDAEDVAWGVEPEQVDPTTVRLHVTVTGTVRGHPVEANRTVPVTLSRGTCTRCGRIAGDYYASIIQLRGEGRTPTAAERNRAEEITRDIVADMAENGDREAFVTEADAVEEGLDVKLSTTKLGQKVAKRITTELGGSFSSSETLVTEDEDGQEVYRVTYAIRLPRYAPGDVIDPADDDGPVLVTGVSGNLKGRRLTSGDPFEVDPGAEVVAAADRLGHRDDGEATALVTVEDGRAVQVLDPETYEATTIPRPSYLDPDAETVPVIKTAAGLHVLPDG